MKHIYLNLKRFDVPVTMGGVNRQWNIRQWGASIVKETQVLLAQYVGQPVEFVQYFPELHLTGALEALSPDSPIRIGCQGVFYSDVEAGKNFGAFTTNRPAAAMSALGVKDVLIGHCEERNDKINIMKEAGATKFEGVNRLLNKEILAAQKHGMNVLYCVGEKSEEQDRWQEVLGEQLSIGLDGADTSRMVIAYEPVWSIGPGKIPADKDYITKIARFIKERTGGLDVVYGGGLKQENAPMLASIPEIDGGLIALTRFSGHIGFYPQEYAEIIHLYLNSLGGTSV